MPRSTPLSRAFARFATNEGLIKHRGKTWEVHSVPVRYEERIIVVMGPPLHKARNATRLLQRDERARVAKRTHASERSRARVRDIIIS